MAKRKETTEQNDVVQTTENVCSDPNHSIQLTNLYVAPGRVYIHICPSCKNRTEITSPNIFYKGN